MSLSGNHTIAIVRGSYSEMQNIEVDDLVVLADNSATCDRWTIGKVFEVYPRAYGRVCNIKVNSPVGEHSCPVTKIAVITQRYNIKQRHYYPRLLDSINLHKIRLLAERFHS